MDGRVVDKCAAHTYQPHFFSEVLIKYTKFFQTGRLMNSRST